MIWSGGQRWSSSGAGVAGLLGLVGLALAGAALTSVARADTLRVPQDYATLSDACAHAEPGDEVVVAEGVLAPSRTGDRFPIRLASPITIRGAGAGATVLDAETASRHFIVAGEGITLVDLTLRRGWANDGGGSIRLESGSASLTAVRLSDNSSDTDGNAVWVGGGTVDLSNCLLDGNGMAGATVCLQAGKSRLIRCTFAANAGPAVEARERAHVELMKSIVAEPGVPSGLAAGIRVSASATLDLSANCFDGCFDGPLISEAGFLPSFVRSDAARGRGLRTGSVRFRDAQRGDFRLREESSAIASNGQPLGAFGGDTPLRLRHRPKAVRREGERPGLLGPSTPNPTHRETTVHFTVPTPGVVDLGIYNVLGQRVRSLLSQHISEGEHAINWDGRDEFGEDLPPGIFFVRVTQGSVTESRRLVLIR